MLNKIKPQLFALTNGSFLAMFRILFGLSMAYNELYYIKARLVDDGFFAPSLLFPYTGFEFIKPMSQSNMHSLILLMLLCDILIALGLFFRAACVTFSIGTFYILMLDKGIYNNHIYMFSLVALILAFTNAHNQYSIKSLFTKAKTNLVPVWNVWLLRFQVIVVYFFGGIAKLNYDWIINQEPTKSYLQTSGITNQMLVSFFTYGGIIFDLGIGFALLFKRTRLAAFILVILFNITNHNLFNDIGVFPFVMLATSILFFNPEDFSIFNKKVIEQDKKKKKETTIEEQKNNVVAKSNTPLFENFAMLAISIFVAFQILFPLRFLLYTNDPNWTGENNYFAWHMKSQVRDIKELNFYIEDSNKVKYPVKINTFINPMQILALSKDPRMLLPLGKFLENLAKEKKISTPKITAKFKVSYNNKPAQYLVDTNINLATLQYQYGKNIDWLKPKVE